MPKPTIVLFRDDEGIYHLISDTNEVGDVYVLTQSERKYRDDEELILPNPEKKLALNLGQPDTNPEYVEKVVARWNQSLRS